MPTQAKRGSQEAAKLVQYEIDMLLFTYSKLGIVDQLEHNVYLESFLIHVRNLIEFLVNERRHQDDVMLEDFLNDNSKIQIINKLVKSFFNKTEMDRIHKMLAHISYERINLKGKWNVGDYFQTIYRALNEFVESLSISNKAWFNLGSYNFRGKRAEIIDGSWSILCQVL